jgi:LmbE family N-acetylglucosaminyl deacetylase
MNNIALAIVTHPDDAEFLCAGTLALLSKKGWEIHIATMTAGDCGSKILNKAEIGEIRKKEAAYSASILHGQYHCVGLEDLFVLYEKSAIIKVLKLLRKVRPKVVFTMSPSCYMVDHEETSRLAQTACFGGGLTNVETPGYEPLNYIPYLYYADAMEGKDKFGNRIFGTTMVDISSVMGTKTEMLSCHKSQREWLLAHHGMDEYIKTMKRQGKLVGKEIGVEYAEGFRQHLGHAYPQENILLDELGSFTHHRSCK